MKNYPTDTIDCITEAETALNKSTQVLNDLLNHYIMGGQFSFNSRQEYLRLITMLDIVGDYATQAQEILAHTKECEEELVQSIWDRITEYFGRPLTDLEAFNIAVALSIDSGKKGGGVA